MKINTIHPFPILYSDLGNTQSIIHYCNADIRLLVIVVQSSSPMWHISRADRCGTNIHNPSNHENRPKPLNPIQLVNPSSNQRHFMGADSNIRDNGMPLSISVSIAPPNNQLCLQLSCAFSQTLISPSGLHLQNGCAISPTVILTSEALPLRRKQQ